MKTNKEKQYTHILIEMMKDLDGFKDLFFDKISLYFYQRRIPIWNLTKP